MSDSYRPTVGPGGRDAQRAHDSYGHENGRRNDRYTDRRDDGYETRHDHYDGRPRDRFGDRYNDPHSHPYDYYRPRSRERSPPTRDNDMRRFGGPDSYHPQDRNGYDTRNDFSFRSNQSMPVGLGQPPEAPRARRLPGRNDRGRGGRNDQRGGRFQNGRRGPPAAHDRRILHSQGERETTPERLDGMVDGASKFKLMDDWNEDSETEGNVQDSPTTTEKTGPAAKRLKSSSDANTGQEKPKWSNPDPYAIIPPVDEARGKRKDVVQLLRKAKVDNEAAAAMQANAVTRNADFISFHDNHDDEPAANHTVGGNTILVSEEGEMAEESDAVDIRDSRKASSTREHEQMTMRTGSQERAQKAASTFSHLKNLHGTAEQPSVTSEGRERSATSAPVRKLCSPAEDISTDVAYTPVSDPMLPRPRHGKKRMVDGDVVKEWESKDRKSSTPWYIDHSATPDIGFWFHKEICDFYEFVKPQPHEEKVRRNLIARIQAAVNRMRLSAEVSAFGSFEQGTYLPLSDMDLVVRSKTFCQTGREMLGKRTVFVVKNGLERAGIAEGRKITAIANARVPIVKFVDRLTGIPCDISFDNNSGLTALKTFDEWRAQYPMLPALLSVLKQWLMMRGLNEVFTGGLGGFSLACMVVSMLQMHPQLQAGKVETLGNLGELLLHFFDLYGNKFNMAKTGICLRPPRYFTKNERDPNKAHRWTILDPNNLDNDLSVGSSSAPLIREMFAKSAKDIWELQKRMSTAGPTLRRGQSFLRLVIGGNYDKMAEQRAHLRSVHEELSRNMRQ